MFADTDPPPEPERQMTLPDSVSLGPDGGFSTVANNPRCLSWLEVIGVFTEYRINMPSYESSFAAAEGQSVSESRVAWARLL